MTHKTKWLTITPVTLQISPNFVFRTNHIYPGCPPTRPPGGPYSPRTTKHLHQTCHIHVKTGNQLWEDAQGGYVGHQDYFYLIGSEKP